MLGRYPPPLCDVVVEPFCGSARYACRYFDRDVWLNDSDPNIFEIWKWITNAAPSDVRTLPEPIQGVRLSSIKSLSDAERKMLGYASQFGSNHPNDVITSAGTTSIRLFKSRLMRIAGRIGHWKVTGLDYSELPNVPGTWFVDPPYRALVGTNDDYAESRRRPLDYDALGKWCLKRKGQLIVCECGDADWLPFRKLGADGGPGRKSKSRKTGELVYYRSAIKTGFGFF